MTKPCQALTLQGKQSGASLIEVLIATVVISIGLLSLASLQVVATRGNQIALHQSQATTLATDVTERIRAQPANSNAYLRNLNDPLPNCVAQLPNNDRVNSAAEDMAQWLNTLRCHLPQSNASVQLVNDELRISITWTDDRELNLQGNATVNTFNYVTRL